MKEEHEVKLDGTEMIMISCICGFILKERKMQSQRTGDLGDGKARLGWF